MTDDMIELARRAVTCPRWRWIPGMLTTDGARVEDVKRGDVLLVLAKGMRKAASAWGDGRNYVPDLTDPATLGCLLALVRDAYKDAYISASSLHDLWTDENGYWGVRDCDGFVIATGRSEREALVIALEKADAE